MLNLPLPSKPVVPSRDRLLYCLRLIWEEVSELFTASGVSMGQVNVLMWEIMDSCFDGFDMVEVADGIGDVMFTAIGFALECGIDMRKIGKLIYESNMNKKGGPVDSNGKQGKPADWTPPDIRGSLIEAGWDGKNG